MSRVFCTWGKTPQAQADPVTLPDTPSLPEGTGYGMWQHGGCGRSPPPRRPPRALERAGIWGGRWNTSWAQHIRMKTTDPNEWILMNVTMEQKGNPPHCKMSIILPLPRASKKLTRKDTFPFPAHPTTAAYDSLGTGNQNKREWLGGSLSLY